MRSASRTRPRLVNRTSIEILAVAGMMLAAPLPTSAQGVSGAGPSPRPQVVYAARSDSSGPVRNLPVLPPLPKVLDRVFERPRKLLPNREGSLAPDSFSDPAVQTAAPPVGAPFTSSAFDGVGNVNAVLPPDPSGAVGPNHYVQMVNLSFAVYDKATGTQLYPDPVLGFAASNNTLWQGFGGACESTNDGDPVVLYDHQADRWLMSQFALPNFPRGPFYQCIAISKDGDPTGDWWRYAFVTSNGKLNDYPKFGLWPDGYYLSINQFKCKFIGCSWGGGGVAAFERDRMLNGDPGARMVLFDLYSTDPNLGGMLPSDWDGATAPPASAPNYFVQMDDDAWGYSGDQLQIWKFHVDWSNPASSSFTPDPALPVMPFDSNLCGYSRNCIPQKGTSVKLDTLADRLMFRLQYRNFGSYQTLVLNHTVDTNSSDHAGIRWYELRKAAAGSWTIEDEATFSPTSDHRWIGSIAMNDNGSIALGYSLSSSVQNPKIMAAGLKSGAGVNATVGQETVIKAGTGSQTHSSGRWGDYSQLTVDPSDGCTFWYTNEYYDSGSVSYGWKTYIGSFNLGDCGVGKTDTLTSVSSDGSPATFGASVIFTATVTPAPGEGGTVTFLDGAVTLGSATLDAGGQAQYSISTLSGGQHAITAVYDGDSAYNGSTSDPWTQEVIGAPTTTSVASSLNPSISGANVTFTATVTSGAAGTVVFKDDGTEIGSAVLDVAGHAQFSTSLLAVGTHPITADYLGDGYYFNPSTSSSLDQVVNAAPVGTFSLSAVPASLSVPQNGTTNAVIQVSSLGGFSGDVVLAASGVPPQSTATFDTNPVVLSGSDASSTLTFTIGKRTPRKTFTITVSGTSGSLTATTTVAVTVN